MIDPIVIREKRDRMSRQAGAIERGTKAANALLWFAEYVTPRDRPEDGIKLDASVEAISTANAELAIKYVRGAAAKFKAQILAEAIEMAKTDFDEAQCLPHPRHEARHG